MQAELEFEREHSFETQELLAKIVDLATKMASEFHLDMSWSDDYRALNFESHGGMTKGLTGTLHIAPDRVRMVLKLPFGLRPMSGTIKTEVEQYLDETIRR